MEPERHNNALIAETGRCGGQKRAERQSAEERSALARYAARSRWYPREAQENTYLVQQALKGKQLPLV
jgi:hypothetical protein